MNREKVVKGLKTIREFFGFGLPNQTPVFEAYQNILTDAIAMLKEQNPVDPFFERDVDGVFVWSCGACGAYLYHMYGGLDRAKAYVKYCSKCGRPVKWDDTQ